jgi:hypothetical protein
MGKIYFKKTYKISINLKDKKKRSRAAGSARSGQPA